MAAEAALAPVPAVAPDILVPDTVNVGLDTAVPAANDAPAAAQAADTQQPAAAAVAESAAAAEAPAVQQTPAEPELVEVWRPGGRSDERRGQQRRPAHWQRSHQSAGEAAATATTSAAADGAAVEAERGPEATVEAGAPAERKEGGQHRRQRQQGDSRREREDRGERRQREYRAEQQRPDRQGDRPERGRAERPTYAKARGDNKDRRDFTAHREREKQADPNSPFAKLAALKAQLEAAAKERR
jgi:ATP-dependent RNA helicase SUPV3L1/SUV3